MNEKIVNADGCHIGQKDMNFINARKILGKKNDSSLRSARSHKTGFKYYTDKQGNIYYNLIEVFNELGIKL